MVEVRAHGRGSTCAALAALLLLGTGGVQVAAAADESVEIQPASLVQAAAAGQGPEVPAQAEAADQGAAQAAEAGAQPDSGDKAAPLLRLSDLLQLALEHSPGLAALDWQSQAYWEQADSVAGRDRLSAEFSILGYQTDGPLGVFGSRLSQGRVTQQDFDPLRLNDPEFLGNVEYSLRLAYPLFNASRIKLLSDALRLSSDAVSLDRLRQEHLLSEQVIKTYFAHDLLEEKLLVLADAAETIAQLQKNIESLHREGLVIGADLAASEVEAASLADERSRSEASLGLTENILAILCGVSTGFSSEILREIGRLPVPPLEDSYNLALKCRPDLQAMESRVCAAGLLAEESSRKRLPMIGLFAEGKNASPDLPGGGHTELTVGAQLKLDLDAGGVISSEIDQKTAEYNAACQTLEQLQQTAKIEVATAHAVLLSADGSRRSLAAQSSKAEENLRVQSNRYREGIGSYLEVRMAATALKESRLRELDADYNYMLAQLQLLVATGQLGSAGDPFLGPGPGESGWANAPDTLSEGTAAEEDHAH